ncbi:MAG: indolepyruvate ferredoxin oxidoreductase subunit alpha, partial [Proteobacteria bacterium]|nr:indolepyruvate ferredoxin oxidoreductase subunit alpha [Pseudomonadota bacterium]
MHKLLTDDPGQKMLLLGNDAIARGAVEAGVGVGATYPGTPSSEISLALFQMSKQSDIYFEYSVNEKIAVEVAGAAANCGVRSIAIMKHVGLNVAADAVMTLAYLGVKGGMVIVSADDPYMFSSQNEQDNRYYGKLSGLPVLEPSTIDEARVMTKYAFELSEKLQEPVILRTTTRINHSTGIVTLGEINKQPAKGTFVKDPANLVCVPAVSRRLHVKLLENIKEAQVISDQSEFNVESGTGEFGIVCNGVSHGYVGDAIKELDVEDKVRVLRIGFSNPMPDGMITKFLKECSQVLVVEEGEPVMEEYLKMIAHDEKLEPKIAGKSEELFSRLYEYDPALVKEKIAGFFGFDYTPSVKPDLSDVPDIPMRPPSLCAGCS